MDTGREKRLHFLSPIPVLCQDHINHMVTSKQYDIQIHDFQIHLAPTFLLSSPRHLYSLQRVLQIVTNFKYFRTSKQLPIPLTSWSKSLFWVENQQNLQHECHHQFNSDDRNSVLSDILSGKPHIKCFCGFGFLCVCFDLVFFCFWYDIHQSWTRSWMQENNIRMHCLLLIFEIFSENQT